LEVEAMVKKWVAIGLLLGGVLVGMGLVPLGGASPFAGEARAETRAQVRHKIREERRIERRLRHEQRRVARIHHREKRQTSHLRRLQSR
jgi:hypothetical protein